MFPFCSRYVKAGALSMSVEVHVFFRGKLPSKTALARTLREIGFPLTCRWRGSLEKYVGFLPMTWDGEETGCEFIDSTVADEYEEEPVEGADPALDRCAVFRLGGDMVEL